MENKQIAGEGGMGVVFKAHDATLDRTLAIKVIRAASLGPEGRERFLREARACSRISHPNIVTVYSAGEDDGRPYLAMEILEGRTLRQIIQQDGPVPWDKAVRWVRDILGALERLHAEGIVHRDLKPDNIILTNDNIVKLMDFGIARLASSATMTQEGAALGTVYYMSPEQVRGEKVDARSDIFAMGGVLYQLLTGRLPFPGEEPLSVMYLIQNEAPKPLAEFSLDVPPELTAILDRALAKNLSDRFPDASSFRTALGGLLQDEGFSTAQLAAATKKQRVLTRIVIPALVLVAIAAVLVIHRFSGTGLPHDRKLAVQHNELGQSLEKQGEPARAEDEYRQAILADPSYAIPWNNLGVLALSRHDLQEADSLFGEAVSRNNTYAAALYNNGTTRWDLKDLAGAEARFKQCLSADSSMVECYNNYGALLIQENRIDEASDILRAGLARKPDNPYLLKNMGTVASRQGMDQAALEYWKRAYEQMPINEDVNFFLATWYQQHGRQDESRVYWSNLEESKREDYRRQAREALQKIRSR
jgi:Tfp pilus assembly protein PilF